MPELWDLYDIDRRPLNRTIQRGKPSQRGRTIWRWESRYSIQKGISC